MRFGNIKICKNVVKGFIFGCGIGALAGAGITYFIMDREMKESEGLLNYLKEQYRLTHILLDGERARKEEKSVEPAEFSENVISESEKKKADILAERHLRDINEKEGYTTPFKPNPKYTLQDNIDELYEIESVFESSFLSDSDDEELDEEECGVYPISYSIFANTRHDYEKTTLGYYSLDDILTDENDDIIDDREDWIGEDGLEHFGDDPEADPDVIYIRNHILRHDYEVVRYTDIHYQEVR